jgi:hypothetical protein
VTSVGSALKSKKLTPCFVSPYEIIERITTVAYRITLPPSLSNLHSVFHMSHVIQVNDLEVRDNLTVETVPLRIEDREVKRLRNQF